MAEEIDVGRLEIDMSGILGANQDLLKSITDVKDNMRTMRKETGNLSNASEDQRKSYVQMDADLKKLNQEYQANKKVLSEIKNETNNVAKAIDKEVKSVGDAKKNNKELRAIRDQLSKDTEGNRKALEKLNAKMTENNSYIKENTNSWEGLSGALDSAVPGFGGMVSGIQGATKAAAAFIATPLGAVLGVIVLALGALQQAFTKNQGLMDQFNKITEQGGAILQAITGRIVKFGSGLAKLLSGNLDGLGEMKESFGGIGEEIKEVVEEAGRLADMEVITRRMAIATSETVSILEKEAATYRGIEADATRSFKAREDAAKKAMDAELQRERELAKLAQQELDTLDIRNKRLREQGLFTDEHWRAEVEARNKVREAETALIQKELENDQIRRQLVQDRLERDLDILIDGADNQKTINEQIIADDRIAFEERQKLLADTEKFMAKSFNKQIKTIEKFTDKQIDENELLMETDAEVLNEKIRAYGLSEIIEGRLLEVVRERRMAEQDLSVAAMDLAEEEARKRDELARRAQQRNQKIKDDRIAAERVWASTQKTMREAEHQQELEDIMNHGESMYQIALAQASAREKFLTEEAIRDKERRLKEVEMSEDSAVVKATLIRQIEEETQIELNNIAKDASDARSNIELDERNRRKQMAADMVSGAQQLLGKLAEINQAAFDTDMDRLDKEKAAIQDKYDKEIEAAAGNTAEIERLENAKEAALAEVEAKAEKRQEEFNKKQEKIQKAQAVFQVLAGIGQAFAQFGPIGAIVAAVAGMALLEAQGVPASGVSWLIRKFRKSRKKNKKNKNSSEEFEGFAEGTDRVTGPGTRTSDSIGAWLSRDEAVIKAKANMDWYPGLSAAMNSGKVDQWVMANFDNVGIKKGLSDINRSIGNKRNIINVMTPSLRDQAYLLKEYGN